MVLVLIIFLGINLDESAKATVRRGIKKIYATPKESARRGAARSALLIVVQWLHTLPCMVGQAVQKLFPGQQAATSRPKREGFMQH